MAVTPTEPGSPTGSSPTATVVVVTGGDEAGPAERTVAIPDGTVVVAADSGVARARALGLRISVVVGDLDSVTGSELDAVRAGGGTVERHPRAKDETDLELALGAALTFAPHRVLVLGGRGGRVDHFLANVLALVTPALAAIEVEARMGPATLTVIRPRHPGELHGAPGEIVSLLPIHGPAVGVATTGLVFPLAGETLTAGSTRGVSNELAAATATVALSAGALVAAQPGPVADHVPTGSTPRPRRPTNPPPTAGGATP